MDSDVYKYRKVRSDFGRHLDRVGDGPTELIVDILEDPNLLQDYVDKNPVDVGVGHLVERDEAAVNTERVSLTVSGMNHAEGGWPKDIHPQDPEVVARYRKKTEKEESYSQTVMGLFSSLEPILRQNSAIDVYESFFTDDEAVFSPTKEKLARSVTVFRDPSGYKRPVSSLVFSPEGTHIACTFCSLKYTGGIPDACTNSYIWQMNNPHQVDTELRSPSGIVSLAYHARNPNILFGGLYSGFVTWWDTRQSSDPVELCTVQMSHTDPVTGIHWINTKASTEFFTASSDGMVKWWDTRKMSDITDSFIMDVRKGIKELDVNHAQGCSVIEYESTIPAKFIAGTELGVVAVCSRKGKSPSDKLGAVYSAHTGPVYTITRHPVYPRNFLTVGDCTARVFSEEAREGAILTFRPDHCVPLVGAGWSWTRPSQFFGARQDGAIDVWDMLFSQSYPLSTYQLCDARLQSFRVQEGGRFLAAGTVNGSIYVVGLSREAQLTPKNDKNAVSAAFERETRRERMLEGRNKELKLKERERQDSGLGQIAEILPRGVPSMAEMSVPDFMTFLRQFEDTESPPKEPSAEHSSGTSGSTETESLQSELSQQQGPGEGRNSLPGAGLNPEEIIVSDEEEPPDDETQAEMYEAIAHELSQELMETAVGPNEAPSMKKFKKREGIYKKKLDIIKEMSREASSGATPAKSAETLLQEASRKLSETLEVEFPEEDESMSLDCILEMLASGEAKLDGGHDKINNAVLMMDLEREEDLLGPEDDPDLFGIPNLFEGADTSSLLRAIDYVDAMQDSRALEKFDAAILGLEYLDEELAGVDVDTLSAESDIFRALEQADPYMGMGTSQVNMAGSTSSVPGQEGDGLLAEPAAEEAYTVPETSSESSEDSDLIEDEDEEQPKPDMELGPGKKEIEAARKKKKRSKLLGLQNLDDEDDVEGVMGEDEPDEDVGARGGQQMAGPEDGGEKDHEYFQDLDFYDALEPQEELETELVAEAEKEFLETVMEHYELLPQEVSDSILANVKMRTYSLDMGLHDISEVEVEEDSTAATEIASSSLTLGAGSASPSYTGMATSKRSQSRASVTVVPPEADAAEPKE